MSEQPQKCPWCTGDAETHESGIVIYVACCDCHARGPEEESEDEAIRQWDTAGDLRAEAEAERERDKLQRQLGVSRGEIERLKNKRWVFPPGAVEKAHEALVAENAELRASVKRLEAEKQANAAEPNGDVEELNRLYAK